MPKAVAVKKLTITRESPPVKPFEEARWQAWKAKGRAEDKNDLEMPMKALTWGLIIALLAFGFWARLAPYDLVIRSVVAAGSIGLMANGIHNRQYTIAARFAALAILYNPVAPLFTLAGNWQRVLVLVSAVPFIASLTRRDLKGAYIG